VTLVALAGTAALPLAAVELLALAVVLPALAYVGTSCQWRPRPVVGS